VQEFFQSIGLDGKLLLSQAVNFLILLAVLRIFAYKPILRALRERRERIAEGIAKATEADARLASISTLKKEKLQEAEREGLALLRGAEERAKRTEAELLELTHKKETDILERARTRARAEEEAAALEVQRSAVRLVKDAIVKTTELDPHAIDEQLIASAVAKVQRSAP